MFNQPHRRRDFRFVCIVDSSALCGQDSMPRSTHCFGHRHHVRAWHCVAFLSDHSSCAVSKWADYCNGLLAWIMHTLQIPQWQQPILILQQGDALQCHFLRQSTVVCRV